ncbi:MAG: MMPL family transporter [Marinilabiliales bacterium]
MWTLFARIILRNRILILSLLILFTAFMTYKAVTGVHLSYEYVKILPEKDTAFVEHVYFKQLFGEEANVMAIGVEDSNFFTIDRYKAWKKLEKDLLEIDGIDKVASIYDILNIVKDTTNKKFDVVSVFPDSITTQEQLDSISNIALSLPFYKNALYNDSNNVYLTWLSLSKDKLDSSARMQLIKDITVIADNFGQENNLKMHFSGLPYIRTEITKKIKTEMNIFIILALVVCIIILIIFFRTFNSVFFSVLTVIVGVIWSFGTLALFHYKITMLLSMIPPLLTIIGVPNTIFMLNKYYAEYKKHGNKIKALQRTIYKIGNAIFLTNLTSASGFATFILTSSEVLKEFGVIASINIIAMFFLSLFIIPIIFSFLPPPKEKHTKHLDNKFLNKIIEKIMFIVINKRKIIYYVTISIVFIGIIGILLMKSTGYMVDDIPHHDRVYVDLKYFEKSFKGVLPYEIVIDTKKPKGAYRNHNLTKIDQFQKYIAHFKEFSKSVSIVDGFKFARQAFYNGKPEHYKLPSKNEQNFILKYISLKDDDKINSEAQKILSNYVDSTGQIARISMLTADVGTVRLSELTDSLKKKAYEIFPKDKYDVILTGISVVFFKGTKYLIRNLLVSLALAIFLISFFMAALFKNFRMVIISLVPNFIPLILTAALMGYFGIPIKPSTILVFSIAFGISVDDTIHYLAKFRQELLSTNWDIGKSVIISMRETGISMTHTSIVLFFGFGLFAASEFGGTQALGILVAFTLIVAMFSNLILLPALLMSMEASIIRKAFNKEPLIDIFNEEEDIELNDLEIETQENTKNQDNHDKN